MESQAELEDALHSVKFMENAWWFPGHLGHPLGGAVVNQHHLAHNKGSQHLTSDFVADKTCLGISISRNIYLNIM